MWSLSKVEHLNLLGDGYSYRYRKFVFILLGLVFFAVKKSAKWDYALSVVSHFYAHGIRKAHHPDASCGAKRHAYIFLKVLHLGYLRALSEGYLIQGHGRAHGCSHSFDFDFIVAKGHTDLVLVTLQLVRRDFELALFVGVEQV